MGAFKREPPLPFGLASGTYGHLFAAADDSLRCAAQCQIKMRAAKKKKKQKFGFAVPPTRPVGSLCARHHHWASPIGSA